MKAKNQFSCSEVLSHVQILDDMFKTCGEHRVWAVMDGTKYSADQTGYLMACVAATGNVALLVSLRYYFASKLSA